MTCARGYDFINSATARLPGSAPKQFDDEGPLDIIRPNQRAEALVAQHLRVLEALRSEQARRVLTGRR